jgi:hypothetical protein
MIIGDRNAQQFNHKMHIYFFKLSCCKENSISCFSYLLILVYVYVHTFHTLNDSNVWSAPVQSICSSFGLILTTLYIKNVVSECGGHTVVQLVKALRYRLEGHGFDSR